MSAVPKPRKRTARKPAKSEAAGPPPTSTEVDLEIEEGINDLMNLSPAVIQKALIERNYHPGIVRTLDHHYCVHLLRECQGQGRGPQKKAGPFTTLRSLKQRKSKAPIFASKPETTEDPED
jgi:hypothetical protein